MHGYAWYHAVFHMENPVGKKFTRNEKWHLTLHSHWRFNDNCNFTDLRLICETSLI